MYKIAAVQMCSSHIVEENLVSAEKFIKEAITNDAKLIIFPEMFAIMGINPLDKVAVKEQYGNGKIQSFLCEQAKNNKIWIISGTIPIACNEENKIRAASLVINDSGQIVARYDKIHLFDVTISPSEIYKESATTQAGDELVVVDTPFGKIGLSVCYDIRFPELFRYLFEKGAEIIAIPSAFTVPTGEAHWELLARSRAVENFSYVIGPCQGGTHSSGRKTYWHSIIIYPWGSVIAKKEGIEAGIIYASIDLEKLYEKRKSIPIAQHQKILIDISKLRERKNSK